MTTHNNIVKSETVKLKGPDIWVELDPEQIFPNDPGQGTPVLVCLPNGETATWNCATCEGETVDGTRFTEEQLRWLNQVMPVVENWMTANNC